MAQYINKDAVVAEIEKLKAYLQIPNAQLEAIKVCDNVISAIDTLEVKEIDNVWHDTRRTIPEDGSEQIICIKEDGLAVSTVGKIVNGTIKWAYLDDLLNISNVQVKETNLEKEAENFVQTKEFVESKESPVLLIAKHFYELGLKSKIKQ